MKRPPSALRRGLMLAAVAGLAGCDKRRAAAQRLVREGLTEVQLTPQGEGFSFTARRGSARCTGSITVASNPLTSSESLRQQCMIVEEPAAPTLASSTELEPLQAAPSAEPTSTAAPSAPSAAPRGTVAVRVYEVDQTGCFAHAVPADAAGIPADVTLARTGGTAGAITRDATEQSRRSLAAWVATLTAPPHRRLVIVPRGGRPPTWWAQCIVEPALLTNTDFVDAQPHAEPNERGRSLVDVTLSLPAMRRVRRLAPSNTSLLFLTSDDVFAGVEDAWFLSRTAGGVLLAFDAMPARFEGGPPVVTPLR